MSPQQLISSMVPTFTDVPGENMRHPKAVPIQKQIAMYTGVLNRNWIKTSLDQLVTPLDIHQSYMSITRQHLKYSWHTVTLSRPGSSMS